MSRADPQFGLRIPVELKDWITERAKQNRRSVTAEMILIMEKEKALSASTPRASDVNSTTSI